MQDYSKEALKNLIIGAKSLQAFGWLLIMDDEHDLGWGKYKNRQGHPDHPSVFHHWHWGTIMAVAGKIIENLASQGVNLSNLIKRRPSVAK